MPLTEEEREIARRYLRERLEQARANLTPEQRAEMGRKLSEAGRKGGTIGGARKTARKKSAAKARTSKLLEADPDAFRKMAAKGGKAGGVKGGASKSAKKVAAARANLTKANEAKRLKAKKPPTPTTQRPRLPPRMPPPPTPTTQRPRLPPRMSPPPTTLTAPTQLPDI